MDKLAIVSIAVLSLVPQLNSQPVNLDTSKAEPIVSGVFVTRENKFPDRSKEAEVARQIDAQREQARLEAIRQAEIQKQAQVQAQAQKPAESPVSVSVSGSCADWIAQAGITDVASALILINRESGCRVNASNPSGAYGIPQALPGSKMASAGADWQTNPVTQLKWMQGYVMGRYGSWANAVAHSNSTGWY